MGRLRIKETHNERDLSLIERILAKEPNPKTASVLALDLILVGIDTVCIKCIFSLISTLNWLFPLDLHGCLFNFISVSDKTRTTRENVQRIKTTHT